ncbi:MAG: hypothetical protein PHS59_00120 [Paludibacter sp.]|nr:hypothetical protein [Paludibacter sp.]
MNNLEFTDQYLKSFDSLSEALYLCWYNSYSNTTKQIDEESLKEQIRSFGFYHFKKKPKKKLPLSFRARLKFKTLIWVNYFTDVVAEDTMCDPSELHLLALKELKNKLLNLKNRDDRIAYANVILRDLDKSHVHNHNVESSVVDFRLKELFGFVLDHNFIAEDNITTFNDGYKINPIYDLTVRLINHLDFIDKLIELFVCFDICLISLAEKAECNLYIFRTNKREPSINPDIHVNAVLPKFNSSLSNDCIVKIMHYLLHKKMLINTNADVWLFWFNRNYIKVPEPLIWDGSPTLLSNVIQHLCGESIAATIKTAFGTKVYVKTTKKRYERGKMYKEIEQIITISKQKNN